ncbi:ABC transporter ATP-binding protein [Nakamurella flava]|nr:ABC transporter ATP-binding protein [Nakamurella flava]
MNARQPMVTAEAAGVRLRRTWVLTDLHLSVAAGQRLHLAGPNGAGKTTVLRCLAGALRLRQGRMTVAGHPTGTPAARAALGLCLNPENGLHPRLTASENVVLGARLRLADRPAATVAAAHVVDEMGMTAYAAQEIRHCSAGQRARVSIARALVSDPPVLLFDEPTRSLDADGRDRFWAALDARPQATVVLVSHDPQDAERCAATVSLPARSGPGPR